MMSFRLDIPVKKSTYERWQPKFSLSDEKKNVFAVGLDKELCDYSVFEDKSPKAMYAELHKKI